MRRGLRGRSARKRSGNGAENQRKPRGKPAESAQKRGVSEVVTPSAATGCGGFRGKTLVFDLFPRPETRKAGGYSAANGGVSAAALGQGKTAISLL